MQSSLPGSQRDAGAGVTGTDGLQAVTCPRCGIRFGCGASAPGCWCESLPVLAEPAPGRGCYCPACLRTLSAESGTASRTPPATSA